MRDARVCAARIGGARHSEIAKEAKVSVPTVFFYFPTREALVKAVLDEVARFLTDMTMRDSFRAGSGRRKSCSPMRRRLPIRSIRILTMRGCGSIGAPRCAMRSGRCILKFQENVVGLIANTIRRWQRERGLPEEEAEDDARLIVGSAHMIAQMKFTRCSPEKGRPLPAHPGAIRNRGQVASLIRCNRSRHPPLAKIFPAD